MVRREFSPRRRACAVVAGVLVPLVLGASVAWACGPLAITEVSPHSGFAGSAAKVSGDEFPGGRVEVRWDTGDGPLLATSEGPSFSVDITIPPSASRGVHYIVVRGVPRTGLGYRQSTVVFEVTAPPALTLAPASGLAGTGAIASGTSLPSGPVEVRWDSTAGALLGSASGPDFSTPITIPGNASGDHQILAFGRNAQGTPVNPVAAWFHVNQPASGASMLAPTVTGFSAPPADTTAPAITGALTRKNGSRTVSRTGEVTLFCGRFTEAGVTGTCGATSVHPLVAAGASRRRRTGRSLTLGRRTFQAQSGRPVMVRFRLTKANLQMLAAAKTVRMRGSVSARDASGNATSATFGVTLKAPRSRGR